ncbi:MAG: hypothetical protein HN940_06480 [Planctomycetes bacterium]|jgi:hypothetical protein|nr:hypothetical protein [Planctomycetota bacterium]MBT6967628.1 hypothetical protein [Planctomycetota bacterium]MBT7103932.1 hypothetical protein [Planctomycetota bacterium]
MNPSLRILSLSLIGILILTARLLPATEFSAEFAAEFAEEIRFEVVPAVELPKDEDGLSAKEIRKLVQQAAMSGDASALAEVLRTVGKMPGRDGAASVLATAAALEKGPDDIYWFLLQGVAGFKGPDAFTEMGEFVIRYKSKAIARDLLNSLRKCRSKYANRVIRRVLEQGSADMQMMAVDIAANVPVRRTVDILMPILAREDAKEKGGKKPATALKRAIIAALEALTRQQLGDSLINWEGWWSKERVRGLKVIRDEAEDQTATTGLARPLDPVRARQFLGLEEMPAGSVLVVKGPTAANGFDTNYDHIEQVLDRIKVANTVVEKGELEDPSFSLDKVAAIFINCSQIHQFCQSPGHTAGAYTGKRLHKCEGPAPHDTVQFKMKQTAVDKLVKWVEKGGYLFTEDWVLVELLEVGFSRFVRAGAPLEGGEVVISPERGMTAHPMLRGVFIPPVDLDALRRERWAGYDDEDDDEDEDEYDPSVEDDDADVDGRRGKTAVGEAGSDSDPEIEDPDIRLVDHRWKIDKESPALDIQSKKVQVLVDSEDLRKLCGEGAVAITFPVKRGRVLHVLSHFGKQSSSENEATIENILVNFLLQVRIRAGGMR